MDDKKFLENNIRRLEKHQEGQITNKRYAIQRIDLLTIAISGGGLYYAIDQLGTLLIHASIILLMLAIISNFISQWTAYLANKNEERWTIQEIRRLEERPNYDKKKHGDADCWVRVWNKTTSWLNVVSTLLMFSGLICIVIHLF